MVLQLNELCLAKWKFDVKRYSILKGLFKYYHGVKFSRQPLLYRVAQKGWLDLNCVVLVEGEDQWTLLSVNESVVVCSLSSNGAVECWTQFSLWSSLLEIMIYLFLCTQFSVNILMWEHFCVTTSQTTRSVVHYKIMFWASPYGRKHQFFRVIPVPLGGVSNFWYKGCLWAVSFWFLSLGLTKKVFIHKRQSLILWVPQADLILKGLSKWQEVKAGAWMPL